MLEKWKRSIGRDKVFVALLKDLLKGFVCLNHDLLIAKLNAYNFSLPALTIIHDYLLYKKQRTRINSSYGTWMENFWRAPQGSILGPLLCNILLENIFFIVNSTDIADYADGNMPYATVNDIDSLTASLEDASKSLFFIYIKSINKNR